MSPKFGRLLAALGAWTLGGMSLLMFLGESPILGVAFAFIGLIVLMVAVTGMPIRERPYESFELLLIWLGFPLVFVTVLVLVAVGFLPVTSVPWLALYAVVAGLLFVMMIFEARRQQPTS